MEHFWLRAVAAGVLRAHMPRQAARLPEHSDAVRARVVAALLVHRAHMRRQVARMPEHSDAVRARVVAELLVHRTHMRRQVARRLEHAPVDPVRMTYSNGYQNARTGVGSKVLVFIRPCDPLWVHRGVFHKIACDFYFETE